VDIANAALGTHLKSITALFLQLLATGRSSGQTTKAVPLETDIQIARLIWPSTKDGNAGPGFEPREGRQQSQSEAA
jgi:hypothetical protein